jgi:hypothetical protein
MTNVRALAIPLMCAALGAVALPAGDFSSYRGMQFGMNVSAAAKLAGENPASVRTIHQRPAVIQEMDWQPRSSLATTDPVKEASLEFFNGELFRIVVTYDRYKVEGMTADDMIESISASYGSSTRPTGEVAYHSIYGEVAPIVARWEDAQYAYNLVRTGDSFALVLYSKRLDDLAQAAITEAVRLEAQEAPQRELDKQKKQDDEERLALEKARLVNKPNFRP